MKGTAHQQRRNQRLLDGRIEARLPLSVPIYLALWRPGEEAFIARRTGEFLQVGRVVYSEQKMGCFCLGVEFLDRFVNWGESFPPLA